MRLELTVPRIIIYAAIIGVIFLAGFIAGIIGSTLCSPASLPGDQYWTWTTRTELVIAAMLRGATLTCFLHEETAAGPVLNLFAARIALIVALFIAGALLWETAGRALRRRSYREKGGHALLAGPALALAALSNAERAKGAVSFLAADEPDRRSFNRGHPFSEVALLGAPNQIRNVLARLGAGKARLVAATTDNDLVNIDIAREVMKMHDGKLGPPLELVVRIEQWAVRSMQGSRLRRDANNSGVDLSIISLQQMQIRRGAELAMSGRYITPLFPRSHVALCGSGSLMQRLAFYLARQAFGLSLDVPLLSVVRTGGNDFTAGALKRLERAKGAMEVEVNHVDADDATELDRVLAAIALADRPLSAVHCVGEDPGEAEALAENWEQVFVRLEIPVPPIIAYSRPSNELGSTGMVCAAGPIDLLDARDVANRIDRRAIATHRMYLDNQRAVKGPDFGSAPAECDWSVLAPTLQDDNRIVADHVDYKLACIDFTAGPVSRAAAHFNKNEIELLAAVEHGRWLAGKYLEGWSHAESRDDTKSLHPSLVPYADLPEAEKQKDRDAITSIPRLLDMVGQSLQREFRGGLLIEAKDMTVTVAEDIAERYAQWQARNPGYHLLAALALEDANHVSLAEALSTRRIALEIIQQTPVYLSFQAPRGLDIARRAAAILRQAHRIAVTVEPASEYIRNHANELVIVRDDRECTMASHAALFDSREIVYAGWLA